jgi:Uncharacterized protein conserved in bacteria
MISPQLKEFESGPSMEVMTVKKSELKLSAAIHKIAYGTNEMSDFTVDVSSDTAAINYRLSCRSLFNTHIKLDHLLVKGKLANQRIFADISSIDDNQKKKLLIRSWVVMDKTNYKITLDPKEFYLMDDRWDLAADHYVKIGKQGILIHHFYIKKAECQINVTSVNDRFKDDISIDINNFRLDDISRIVEKDTSFLKGKVDGTLLLKRVKDKYGMIADAQISNLFVHEVPIGNLVLKARNTLTEKFDIALNLSGAGNELIANGFYIPNLGPHSLSLKIHVSSLSMQTVQALSFGELKEATGNLSGNFAVEGSSKAPDFSGNLTFNDVHLTPTFLNSSLELKHETVFFKNNGIYFNSFTFLDKKKHPATIDGTILMTNFKNPTFALHANSTDFTLFNSTAENNKNYFGRMIVDSKIDITGPKSHPVINGRLKMKKGSHFTFAVPEKKQTADKGEDVVEFKHSGNPIPILDMKSEKETSRPTLKGLELFSIIEIDKQATLSLLIDPESSDSLVVKGEAALSLTTDRSGKMSLTGTYNLDEGSYGLTLKSIIKKKFDIESGSNIIWNGNPLDGDIAINAIYLVRTSPSDLITDQMADLSESEMNAYKQRYPFLVYLKLRGSFLNPEISFEIKLPPNEKGVLNGAIDNKLTLLNDDPSALNKQVFALLVLGRFIQENPLQTESYSVSSATRLTIGKFLSTQLNRWSSNIIPGVDLNFDVESYDEIQSGQTQGRTQVDIGLKKRLLDDRLQVQVGGIFEVEGDKARQNSASEIVSDITLEYMITKDGRYRLKGYRHNQYEGDIDGQLVETGVGLQFVRDFTKWKYLFRNPKRNSSKKNSNGTVKNQ